MCHPGPDVKHGQHYKQQSQRTCLLRAPEIESKKREDVENQVVGYIFVLWGDRYDLDFSRPATPQVCNVVVEPRQGQCGDGVKCPLDVKGHPGGYGENPKDHPEWGERAQKVCNARKS